MDSQLENLTFLLNNTNSTIWGIWSSDSKRVQEFKGENVQDAVNYLNRVFPYLEKKRFEFRYRPLNSNEKGQFYQSFDLSEKRNMSVSNVPQFPPGGTGGEMVPYLMQLVQLCAKLEHKVGDLEKKFEKLDKEVGEIYGDLTDSSPKNDKNAIDRLGKLLDKTPSMLNAVKSAKELF